MPSPTPKESARTTNQCAFVENGRRCRRNAVRSELCGAHLSMVESGMAERVSPIADLVDRLFRGQRVPKATIEELASDAVSAIVGRRVTIDEIKRGIETGELDIQWDDIKVKAKDAYSQVSSRVRSSRQPMSDEQRAQKERETQEERARHAKLRERAGQVSRARRILGYSAKEPLTKDQVKQKHRELARKHHPDRGGKLERMQEINWAVDILLAPA